MSLDISLVNIGISKNSKVSEVLRPALVTSASTEAAATTHATTHTAASHAASAHTATMVAHAWASHTTAHATAAMVVVVDNNGTAIASAHSSSHTAAVAFSAGASEAHCDYELVV